MTEGVWLWAAFALMAMTTIGTRGRHQPSYPM